jgi:iron(III) transport system permease protein
MQPSLAPAKKELHFDIKWLIVAAIVALLLIFEVFPLIYLVLRSVFSTGRFSIEAFQRVYSYELNWEAVRNTLVTATLSMFFGIMIAFPLAWLVGRTNLYGKKFFRTLFVMTYMVPPYVGAMAWLRLLNPRVGTLNVFIQKLLGLPQPPFNIYSIGGLVWVLTTFYYPYAFITISRAMEKMDPSLEEASRISGASPLKTLFTVTLPMMTPSIVAAALLVFVSAASCYGIPSIIGAPGQIHTVTTRIIDFVYIGSQEGLTDATTLAVFLMLISNAVLYVSTFVLGRRQYITVSGKSTRPNIVDLGRWRILLTVLVALFSVDEARHLVHLHGWVSAVGHEATAAVLSRILRVNVPMNRVEYQQQVGQLAIALTLNQRAPEGQVLSVEEMLKIGFSLLLLERLE